MYKVIVAGNIGSGKSSVVAHLGDLGALVVSLDAINNVLLADDENMRSELVDAFGSAILDESGAIDHAALAREAFVDEASTDLLNSISHPYISHKLDEVVSQAECGCLPYDAPVLVMEVPLLAGSQDLMDLADEVLVVTAPREVRFQRLLARGLTAEDIENRMARQPEQEELEALATTVFDNSGSLADMNHELDFWWLSRNMTGWESGEGHSTR